MRNPTRHSLIHKYPTLSSEQVIKDTLHEIGVDVFEPSSKSDESIALALEEFSNYCLVTHSNKCLHILETSHDGSVGELQGGSTDYSIYRVSFPEYGTITTTSSSTSNRNMTNAAETLLYEFNHYIDQSRNHSTTLTLQDIQQYMLSMLQRRSAQRKEPLCTQLGNIMFIMQFGGPTSGQVRHIDNMVSNIQVCLYMSNDCPSTIVYVMDELNVHHPNEMEDGQEYEDTFFVNDPDCGNETTAFITNSSLLLQYWEQKYHKPIPNIIRDILDSESDVPLMSKWYTKYFGYWKTLNEHLYCFGKLYQDVRLELGLKTTTPGTVLLAGGNEVHAGPPTHGSRMFAFAIGIPEDDNDVPDNDGMYDYIRDHENDGEVQYNPVLLHIDICTLLFVMMDYNDAYHGEKSKLKTKTRKTEEEHNHIKQAKRYLLDILVVFIQDYPMRAYLSQIKSDRVDLLSWMEKLLDSMDLNQQSTGERLNDFIEEAVQSDAIFYTPEVIKKRYGKKYKRRNVKRT